MSEAAAVRGAAPARRAAPSRHASCPYAVEPAAAEAREAGRRVWRASLLANAIGAAVTFQLVGALIPIFLDAADRAPLGVRNLPLIVLSFLIAGPIERYLLMRRMADALDWIAEARAPTEQEQRKVLELPLGHAGTCAIAWGLSLPFFFAVNAIWASPDFAAIAVTTMALGGLTTAAAVYLLIERILRPLTALALDARPPATRVTPGIRARLTTTWALATAIPVLGILLVAAVGLAKPGVDVEYVAYACVLLGAVALGLGWLATQATAVAIADPLRAVRNALGRIEEGELGARVEIDDGSEIGLLQAGFNRMADGLDERERIRDLFGRHVGGEVAQAALANGATLGGEEREIGALFVDLVGSTALAHDRAPTEVVDVLNRFFHVVVATVEAERGLVNKFEGDAALCVFGAPADGDDPAGDALRAARELAERLRREVPEVDFGIGVSAGRAVAGNVGAEHRLEYTVIGDPVNEAARLGDRAKSSPERVLASGGALERARDPRAVAAWTTTGHETLRGRATPTVLCAPVDGDRVGPARRFRRDEAGAVPASEP